MSPPSAAEKTFLGLPAELRNTIHKLAIIEPEVVTVDGSTDIVPGLLRVSKQVRTDTVGLFYTSNAFRLEIYDFDVTPVVQFKKTQWANWASSAASRLEEYRSSHGIVDVVLKGELVWGNVVEWCRLVHTGEMFDLRGCSSNAAVVWVFEQLAEKMAWKWGRVRNWLYMVRPMVADWYIQSE